LPTKPAPTGDAIASYQQDPRITRNPSLQEFQLWILEVDTATKTGRLALYEDSDCPPVLNQDLEYTDFPEASIRFYVENGVVLLPSEH
jgi:hypothetical protein